MKNMKKVIAMLFAAVMVLAMSITAFAADSGSITIRNATLGMKYEAFKVFDLTYAGDKVSYSYTAGEDDDFLKALQGENSPFTVTESSTAGVYNVALKTTVGENDEVVAPTAAEISEWLTANKDALGTAAASTDDEGATTETLVFEDLDYGYYYITSALGTTVTLDSTLPDVTVIDKNQGPSWDNDPENPHPDDPNNNPGKYIILADGTKVQSNSVNYGDDVNFSIGLNAPAFEKDQLITYYYIKDTLADGFGPARDIVVKVDGAAIGTDAYTLTQVGNEFTITIPFGEKYGTEAVIEVTYTATINADGEDVVIAGDGNKNTANFSWASVPYVPDNDPPTDPDDPEYPEDPNPPTPGDPEDPEGHPPVQPNPPYNKVEEKTTTTYVYAIAIDKVDATTGEKLADAHFNIANIQATLNEDGTYSFVIVDAENATDFVTNADGQIVLKGVAEGTYTITETQAPNGYNKLTAPVSVTAQQTGSTTTTVKTTKYYDEEGNLVSANTTGATAQEESVTVITSSLTVENNSGVELPSTGGIGTTIFYVLGGCLVVVAGVLLITKKRMSVVK